MVRVLPAESLLQLLLELQRLVQSQQNGLNVASGSSGGARGVVVQDLREMRPGDFAEVHAEHLRHPPRIGEELPHLLLGTQLALEPGVPPLRAIQASHLAGGGEHLPVRSHLLVAYLSQQLIPDVGLQHVHHQAGVGQRRGDGGAVALGVDVRQPFKVLEQAGAQHELDGVNLAAHLANLGDGVERIEVRGQLVHRLQHVGSFFVPALGGHGFKLIHRGHEHGQTAQHGDGGGEVSFRVVQLLDVAANLLNHELALLRLRLDVPDARKEILDCRLGVVQVLLRAVAGAALLAHGVQDVAVHAADAQAQILEHGLQP
mmetsp:Transcript_35383/g.67681  ORF Transcript_35383/g.67681 Transcript_35383/m.67681 type:complete len:316 (-) Transcript_35383:190-1137(-)